MSIDPLEFVGGAVLGTAFSAVYAGVQDRIAKNDVFKGPFKYTKSKLDTLKPLLDDMTLSNKQLSYANSYDELRDLEQVLKAGEELVLKCSNVSWWDLNSKYKYATKLVAWGEDLESQSKMLQALLIRDWKRIAVGVENIEVGVSQISSEPSYISPNGTFSPNGRPKPVITLWEKGVFLGRGSFASVYEGFSEEGCFIAVKEVSLLDQETLGRQRVTQLEQEIALLSQFEHENIVQYYGTQKDESKLYIFLELVTKGSLQKLYETYCLIDSHVSAYTRQILQGLKYLHDQNVIHRDIKCANILVHANGSVKLADFGLAKTTRLNDIKSCKGTAYWMAPEVVNIGSQGYGLPADIWSLGCTVLEMLTRHPPYSKLEWQQALWKIGKEEPPLVPDSLSKEAQDFIHLCLQVKPDDRPTAAQLLRHPFVNRSLPPTPSGSVSPSNQHRQS